MRISSRRLEWENQYLRDIILLQFVKGANSQMPNSKDPLLSPTAHLLVEAFACCLQNVVPIILKYTFKIIGNTF